MKKLLFAVSLFFLCNPGGMFAQTIGNKELNEIKSSFVKDAHTTALQNMLTEDNNIKKKALNHDLQGKIDHYFKYRTDVKGITDQKSSGTCWMFTSMNVLRPTVMKKYDLNSFDFSHSYTYFWDIFEKANLFLENIIGTVGKDIKNDQEVVNLFRSPVGDGGVWNMFYNIAEKYGVVPQSVMPATAHSNSTGQMVGILNERLRAGGYKLRGMAAERKKPSF